jgi:hypothetical protein
VSNEKIIREHSRKYLLDNYGGVVKDEFGTFLNVRTDLLNISDEHIISLEVKSDKDTFARLENQLDGYMSYSTGVYVALDEIHYDKYVKKFLENSVYKYYHVGILVYSSKSDTLELKREINHYQEITMLYDLITSQELTEFFRFFKGKSKIPKDERTSKKLINTIFTYEEIYNISKEIFMNRFKGFQGFSKEIIVDFEHKQLLFDNWMDESNWKMFSSNTCSWMNNNKQKAKRSSLKCLERNKG